MNLIIGYIRYNMQWDRKEARGASDSLVSELQTTETCTYDRMADNQKIKTVFRSF